MKRRVSSTVPETSKSNLKYQNLMEEFLDLQKEFVSKKRKLQAIRQKRETLVAEIRFLSQRRKNLLKLQHPKGESGEVSKVLERKQNLGGVKEEVLMEKKSQNCLSVNKMVGKKKILWKDQEDQVFLEF